MVENQQPEARPVEKFVLIDNGLLGHLCRKSNEHAVDRFFNSLHRLAVLGKCRTDYITTPFILLEAIGVKGPSIPTISIAKDILESKSVEDVKEDVFNHALSHFSNHPNLSPITLRKRAQEQLNHSSDMGKQLFHRSIGHKVQNQGFEDLIYKNLAFDYMYKFEYPLEAQRLIHASFAIDVHRALTNGWEISQFRAARNSWKHLHSRVVKEKIFSDENLVQIQDSIRLENRADLLDTELIHYAVIGKLVGDALRPVDCFTCDKEEQIKHRIGLYKSFLKPVWDVFDKFSEEEIARLPFKRFDPANGRVFVCDSEGNVISTIDVASISSIDDFQPILDDEKGGTSS